MGSKDYLNRKNEILSRTDKLSECFGKGVDEARRVLGIAENTKETLDNLDEQFSQKTGLMGMDIPFLFVAVGLQLIRQYLCTQFPQRMDDKTAAKNTKGHMEEHSNRKHRYYNPSFEEIITNPVPFDANIGSSGALSGGGKMGHRVTAIGHDPLLGLFFGTANIATSTLTNYNFESFHIYTNCARRDYFKNHARTELVISNTISKAFNQGMEGKKIIAASLMKEIIHLKSDINTKHGLPLPVVSVVDPKKASQLAIIGFDMSNMITIGKQATYASLINMIIAMIHGMFFVGENEMERKNYEVRTRKIISYSNFIATSTNLAVVAVTKEFNKLDLGGIAVTIYNLIMNDKFTRQIKEEFIFGMYKNMIIGSDEWMFQETP